MHNQHSANEQIVSSLTLSLQLTVLLKIKNGNKRILQIHTHACMHTNVHACKHTHTTHTHTHTHTHLLLLITMVQELRFQITNTFVKKNPKLKLYLVSVNSSISRHSFPKFTNCIIHVQTQTNCNCLRWVSQSHHCDIHRPQTFLWQRQGNTEVWVKGVGMASTVRAGQR